MIARALLKEDSKVYIFDEAASNIDVESEELIMNVIHDLAKTKTVLLISHRLANVVKSDKIYFLKDGEIKESGKHEELMSQNGAYRHLYESLIGLVKPLLHIMLAAIILGTLGYLCAIFLTILAGQVIIHGLLTGVAGMIVPVNNMWLVFTTVKTIITVMIVIAVLRGILHYMEQYCDHFIAFKLLAIIRHKVFAAL